MRALLFFFSFTLLVSSCGQYAENVEFIKAPFNKTSVKQSEPAFTGASPIGDPAGARVLESVGGNFKLHSSVTSNEGKLLISEGGNFKLVTSPSADALMLNE